MATTQAEAKRMTRAGCSEWGFNGMTGPSLLRSTASFPQERDELE
jgi:hypothetical protein